ncbi:MAG: HAD family phosphatase [Candidatus Bathyarchaeota archaeon]
MQDYNIIVFDIDGTLIKEMCWEIIHRHFEIDWNKTSVNINDYCNGKISFQQLTDMEIELWRKSGKLPHVNEVKKALQKYTLMKNSRETIDKLKREGYAIFLITYGLDILANRIASELNIDFTNVFANELKIDREGWLIGGQITRVALGKKSDVLKKIAVQKNIPLSQFIAVGDSKYDLNMFKVAGLKIALNPKDEEIKKAADTVIETEDLANILSIITPRRNR